MLGVVCVHKKKLINLRFSLFIHIHVIRIAWWKDIVCTDKFFEHSVDVLVSLVDWTMCESLFLLLHCHHLAHLALQFALNPAFIKQRHFPG
jgi:hypothetical protein